MQDALQIVKSLKNTKQIYYNKNLLTINLKIGYHQTIIGFNHFVKIPFYILLIFVRV